MSHDAVAGGASCGHAREARAKMDGRTILGWIDIIIRDTAFDVLA
jgi:hypothetical protein